MKQRTTIEDLAPLVEQLSNENLERVHGGGMPVGGQGGTRFYFDCMWPGRGM